ncbi:MAG: hypothetical protein IPP55_04360 [Anaerolineales bacterium]|nr:hypothetical protein [Anaerolineales bacterium]
MLIHPSPHERITALTDVFLGALAAWAAAHLFINMGFRYQVWGWAFSLLAASSLIGAIAHGFVMTQKTNTRIWMPLNLLLGLALGLFVVGACVDLSGEGAARMLLPFMLVVGVGFFLFTLWKPGTFMTFIAYEALAMVFALGVYAYLFFTAALAGAGWMLAGVLVTISAAVVQATGKAGKSIFWYFDNNGVFHLIQMAGMVLLFMGLKP